MKVSQIPEFFARLAESMPNPEGELDYVNMFTLLVAVVLSAQATDKGVNKATKKLFQLADTPEKMVALGEEGIREKVKTIGLYRNKAKNVYALSRKLIDLHNSEVPQDRDALMALPGVGRKTANVVLNIGFGEARFAVDTHVFRLSNRTGIAPGKNELEVEKKLDRRVPDPYRINAHHWLILHGRYVCKARKPDCPKCVVQDLCRYRDKTKPLSNTSLI